MEGLDLQESKANYIDNKKFYIEISKWIEEVNKAKKLGIENPPTTEYLGECYMLISKKLGGKYNFSGYTFVDDMISDGYMNCILYADRFDPEKGSNPFAYFTRIIWFAFLRRIAKEKKSYKLKYKLIENMDVIKTFLSVEDPDNKLYIDQYVSYLKEFTVENPKEE